MSTLKDTPSWALSSRIWPVSGDRGTRYHWEVTLTREGKLREVVASGWGHESKRAAQMICENALAGVQRQFEGMDVDETPLSVLLRST